jgi:SAM-dependent methyltransferase
MPSTTATRASSFRGCGACGRTQKKLLHHQNFVVPEGYPLPAEYDVVCCTGCGFVFADPAATQSDYDFFYREWSKYDDPSNSTGSGLSEYDYERLRIAAADLAQVLPSKGVRILDAGCATGGLLVALHELGFASLAGLDPSPRCCSVCRKVGFKAFAGSITHPPADLPQFDCIVLSHVLEHAYDIPAFFGAARRLLDPGGYLYLEVPDATRYFDYLYAPFQEFNTEHVNHFSAGTLQNVAQRFGFTSILVEPKLIRTAKETYYPAVFGIFRDTGGSTQPACVICDKVLPSRIGEYIRRSSELMDRISRNLAILLANRKRILFWGAGQLAMKLLTLRCLAGTEVLAIVDSNPVLHGKKLAGAPIVSPEQIDGSQEPILITTLLHRDEIAGQVRRLGLHNPILHLLPYEHTAGDRKP